MPENTEEVKTSSAVDEKEKELEEIKNINEKLKTDETFKVEKQLEQVKAEQEKLLEDKKIKEINQEIEKIKEENKKLMEDINNEKVPSPENKNEGVLTSKEKIEILEEEYKKII